VLLSPKNAERLIGFVIAIFGIVYSIHTLNTFDLGTVRRMGPGMFPLGLGVTMTLLGIAIAVLVPEANRETQDFAWRPLALVMISLGAFAVGISYLGLFPAVILCVLIVSFAEQPFKPIGAVGTAAALCLAAWLIFKVGLGLTLPLFRWPF
jgi:hypothetical protein